MFSFPTADHIQEIIEFNFFNVDVNINEKFAQYFAQGLIVFEPEQGVVPVS